MFKKLKGYNKSLWSTAFILLITLFVLTAAITYAWLAANRDVYSRGMNFTASTTANLVISGDISGERDIKAFTNQTTDSFFVNWATGREKMSAATHKASSDSLLEYVTNANAVDVNTGLAKTDDTLSFADVPVADDSEFYYDFVVYIASLDLPIENVSLVASIVAPEVDADTEKTHKAFSIDFYLGSPSADSFKGTLNLASLDASANDASTAKTDVEILPEGGNIPWNQAESGDKYITVTMRCYFDGALKDTSSSTFINSYDIVADSLSVDVRFSAVSPEPAA